MAGSVGYVQRILLIVLATISIGFMLYSYQRSSLATSSYHTAVKNQFTDFIQPASPIPQHSAADVRAEAKRITNAFVKAERSHNGDDDTHGNGDSDGNDNAPPKLNRWQRMKEDLKHKAGVLRQNGGAADTDTNIDDSSDNTKPITNNNHNDDHGHDHGDASSSSSSVPKRSAARPKHVHINKPMHEHKKKRESSDEPDPRLPPPPGPFDILPEKALPLPTLPDDFPRPHMTVLTFATHAQFKFCELVESCLQSGISLRVLGWGLQRGLVGVKLPGTVRALDEMPDDDVVLFVDGFDVLVYDSMHGMLDSFLAMNVPLLFQGEKGCWPWLYQDEGVYKCFDVYPYSPSPYRFLNSGAWIGRVWAARRLLGALIAGKTEAEAIQLNDQEVASEMFVCDSLNLRWRTDPEQLKKQVGDVHHALSLLRIPGGCNLTGEVRYNIHLDHYCHIFQSLHNSGGRDKKDVPQVMEVHVKWDDKVGGWLNHNTGTYPSVFHFNGGGKAFVETIHGKLHDQERHEGADGLTFDNHPGLTFEEVCPEHAKGARL